MKIAKYFVLSAAVVLSLTACAGGTAPANMATTKAATTQTTTTIPTTTSDGKATYAYLGYGEVPDCTDLALIASREYYTEYTHYFTANYDGEETCTVYEVQEAYDLNNFAVAMAYQDGTVVLKNAGIDGMHIYAAYESGYYRESDLTSTYEEDRANMQAIIEANDDSNTGIEFVGTGTGVIPLVDDTTEYEYYEFQSGSVTEDGAKLADKEEAGIDVPSASLDEESAGTIQTTRLYLKDGKLIAQVDECDGGRSVDVRLYHTITSEIPSGFMTLPDTTGLQVF